MIQTQQQDPWQGRMPTPPSTPNGTGDNGDSGYSTILLIFIPVMVVVLTVLLGLVVFLVAVLYMRRRKGIRLTEDGGPLDLSKSDGVIGEGGVEGVESRWLETLDPDVKEAYKRAKDWQLQYPPASVPTDITLSQFLSIQEKGVSAWSFEPDYEDNLSLYVQSRTEITFLADGPGMPAREGGGNSVMANLPLPKLNEVYYWEVKMYDKPSTTEVAIGLATKPYPSFRLPGWNKYSVAYFASDGFKSHNYPFTASSYGPSLNEGDVLGVGYKPRTGTVFFTRNGRKMDDAYTGLQRLNLFPTIGANGPCTIHVNLGQAGFVFIEANVKKWGLAPMVGTLAPPPAYGSERGSILLDAGYGTPHSGNNGTNLGGVNALLEAARSRGHGHGHGHQLGTSAESSTSSVSSSGRRNRTPRRSRQTTNNSVAGAGSIPAHPSPLREANTNRNEATPGPGPSTSRARRTFGRHSSSSEYVSPTDLPTNQTRVPPSDVDDASGSGSEEELGSGSEDGLIREREQSPIEHNPPTPNLLDISMHSLRNGGQYFGNRYGNHSEEEGEGEGSGSGSGESDSTARPTRLTLGNGNGNGSPPPPGYAPLDPHVYAAGLPGDLPEEMVNQAIAAMSGDSNITPAQIQAAAQAVSAQAQANAQAMASQAQGQAQGRNASGQSQSIFSWFRERI
uniref:Endosome protein n=1 Tax=Kwoniella bestiolae CBS 10118 TaxID=1296100 RepID=A0A1B9G4M4_9TREE|nr:endosome protein [Kwoniella bestiolae CBS 10118]OCF25985.1 endosome protein [Kwoniella bestiolae CBS 10118]